MKGETITRALVRLLIECLKQTGTATGLPFEAFLSLSRFSWLEIRFYKTKGL